MTPHIDMLPDLTTRKAAKVVVLQYNCCHWCEEILSSQKS